MEPSYECRGDNLRVTDGNTATDNRLYLGCGGKDFAPTVIRFVKNNIFLNEF